MSDEAQEKKPLTEVKSDWGNIPQDNFGYASDEERRAKRGLEDWELVETIPQSQKGVPYWFVAITVTVLLVAIGLSFPFWGNRPGYEQEWFNWGFVAALFYIAGAAALVYFMVQLYGSPSGGKLDSDREPDPERKQERKNGDKE